MTITSHEKSYTFHSDDICSNCSPIAFFAFNRPSHTARSLTALAQNKLAKKTDLHIFIDGARNPSEATQVNSVKYIAKKITGFKSVTVYESKTNQGLYRAITTGISKIISMTGRVIIVEDDILVSKYFLTYMNEALERYEHESKIGSIHAYCPPISGLPDFFFLRGADCWGWATWLDRWNIYNHDSDELIYKMVKEKKIYDFLSIYGHHSLAHLINHMRGKNQSWAANWHASLFLADKLTLHPGQSFIENIGNDASGTHTRASDLYTTQKRQHYDKLPTLGIHHCKNSAKKMRNFMDNVDGKSIKKKILRWSITLALVLEAKRVFILKTCKPNVSLMKTKHQD